MFVSALVLAACLAVSGTLFTRRAMQLIALVRAGKPTDRSGHAGARVATRQPSCSGSASSCSASVRASCTRSSSGASWSWPRRSSWR